MTILSSLQPAMIDYLLFCHIIKPMMIWPIVYLKSPFEKIKLISSVYPFNSLLISSITGSSDLHNKKGAEGDKKGYMPLYGVWKDSIMIVNNSSANIDFVKVKELLRSLSGIVKRPGSRGSSPGSARGRARARARSRQHAGSRTRAAGCLPGTPGTRPRRQHARSLLPLVPRAVVARVRVCTPATDPRSVTTVCDNPANRRRERTLRCPTSFPFAAFGTRAGTSPA